MAVPPPPIVTISQLTENSVKVRIQSNGDGGDAITRWQTRNVDLAAFTQTTLDILFTNDIQSFSI